MADTETAKTAGNTDTTATNGSDRAPRTTPQAGTVVSEIPSSSRQGFWAGEFDWFKANPKTVKMYKDVSPTTASYLRSEYGLDAHSRNSHDKRCDLYVQYDPETAQAIKDRPKRTRAPKGAGQTAAKTAAK